MARTDFITIPIPIIIIIIIVVTITIIIIIIIIVTITIIAMPIIAALLWEKSSTVASFAAPAEPSRCLRSSDVLSHIVEVGPPAMGSTCTGSSAGRWRSRCPRHRPGTSRCSSGEAAGRLTGRRRLRRWGEDKAEWRVGVCGWPSSSDSPSGHLQELVATHWSK